MPERIPFLSALFNKFLAHLPLLNKLCLCHYVVARPRVRETANVFSTTIVIPCRNERRNIEAAVQRIPPFGGHQEIIFVDGHSTDWLLNQRIKDTLCGTKVLFRRDYERLVTNRDYFGDFDPFGDFDLLFGASKLNLHILEIPIRYQGRTYGSSNIQRFVHGWLLLKMTVDGFFRLKAV